MPATSGSTRVMPVWLLALAVLLLIARVTLGIVEYVHPPLPPSLVRWHDPKRALSEAQSRGLPLLYAFVKNDQKESMALESEIFGNPRLARLINESFIPVRMVELANGTRIQIGGDLAGRYKIDQRPALVVANPSNDRHDVLQGYPGLMRTSQWLTMAPLSIGAGRPLGGSLPFPGSPGDSLGAAPADSVIAQPR